MSDNHIDPDMAAEVFILEPRPNERRRHACKRRRLGRRLADSTARGAAGCPGGWEEPHMNSRKSIAAAALVGSAVVFLIASSSFGRDGATGPEDRKLHPQPQRLAAAAHGAGSRRPQGRQGPVPGVRRHATRPRCLGRIQLHVPEADAARGRRLRRHAHRPQTPGQIVIADSTPFRKGRSWSVGVKNLSDQPREFYVGVVCVG